MLMCPPQGLMQAKVTQLLLETPIEYDQLSHGVTGVTSCAPWAAALASDDPSAWRPGTGSAAAGHPKLGCILSG